MSGLEKNYKTTVRQSADSARSPTLHCNMHPEHADDTVEEGMAVHVEPPPPVAAVTNVVKIHLTRTTSRMPQKATAGAAAFDVYACVDQPRERTSKIPLGFRLQMPPNMYAKLHGRSGYAAKEGFVAHEGIIDQDYTGELCMIIQIPPDRVSEIMHLGGNMYQSWTGSPFKIGDRVGQITFHHCVPVEFEQVSDIQETARGAGGFGSTGTGPTITSTSSGNTAIQNPGSHDPSPLEETRRACEAVAHSPLGKRESPTRAEEDDEVRDPPPSVASSPAAGAMFPSTTRPSITFSSLESSSASGGAWR